MAGKRFLITGITLTGNMGGAAMLQATLQQLRQRFPGSEFDVVSIYPGPDRDLNREPDVHIVNAAPMRLLAWFMPLTLVAMLGGWARRLLVRCSPFFGAVARADAVIDLSGIAFVDGRGLPLLWYNLSCALPGMVWRKPVFKLSQALGPFRTFTNRRLAKPLLERCAAVIARGEQSREFLAELGLRNPRALPDVSFALHIPVAAVEQARVTFGSFSSESERPWVIVSPSLVVARLCTKRGIDFLGEMSRFVQILLDRFDVNVLILPHSLGKGTSKNNDVDLCRQLHARTADAGRVAIHLPEEDPISLRALIGQGAFFVGCRFHAVVAALITGVPTLILGWSHKYREMAAAFDADIPSFDFSTFSADTLAQAFEIAWVNRDTTRARLVTAIPRVSAEAAENFAIVERKLRSLHAGQ